MALDCAKLSSAINTGCPAPARQFERTGWLVKYEDVIDIIKSGNTVKFKLLSGMIHVYDRSPKPFNGTQIAVEQGDYYVKFNETVQFPVLANDTDGVDVTSFLKNNKVVVMLENVERGTNDTSRYQIFGLNGGLRLVTDVNDSASDIAWLATLTDVNIGSAGYFVYDTDLAGTTTLINLLTNYDWLGTGYLNSGDTYCAVTSNPAYYYNTSGVLTSFSGTLAQLNYAGVDGWDLIFVVPKVSTSFQTHIGDGATNKTNLRGSLNVLLSGTFGCVNSKLVSLQANNASNVDCSYSTLLTSLRCKTATTINASVCALSVDSIAQILEDAVILGSLDGSIDISGGTNAGIATWTDAMLANAVYLTESLGWTLVNNS